MYVCMYVLLIHILIHVLIHTQITCRADDADFKWIVKPKFKHSDTIKTNEYPLVIHTQTLNQSLQTSSSSSSSSSSLLRHNDVVFSTNLLKFDLYVKMDFQVTTKTSENAGKHSQF